MAQYSNLKAYIEEKIYENGTQAITGDILQDVLKVMTDDLGEFYQTGGVASPSTDPGTPDAKVIYFATEAGTYTNFGGITLAAGEVALLIFETRWTKVELNVLSSANGGVKTANLADGAVTTEKIAGGAVETAKIANSAVTSGKVADGAIGTAKIADGAIDADKIAANAVESAKIKNGAVTEGKINDGAVTAGKVAANAVTTAKIADDAVTTAKLNDGAVAEDKIATDAVTSGKVKDGAIGTAKIAAGAVTHAKIGAGAVEESNIKDGAVTSDKIANGAVGSDQLAEGAFSAENLADGSVTTDKLADEAVTAEKIADGAVTAGKFANGSVTTIKLGSGAVTTEKIGDGMVTRQKLADSSVSTSKIIDGAVTTDKVADGAITDAKLENPVSVSQNTQMVGDKLGSVGTTPIRNAVYDESFGLQHGYFGVGVNNTWVNDATRATTKLINCINKPISIKTTGNIKIAGVFQFDGDYDQLQYIGVNNDTYTLTKGYYYAVTFKSTASGDIDLNEVLTNCYIGDESLFSLKLIKLAKWGSAGSPTDLVVGDIYTPNGTILIRVDAISGGQVTQYTELPFVDGAVYICDNRLYIYNGTILIEPLAIDCSKSVFNENIFFGNILAQIKSSDGKTTKIRDFIQNDIYGLIQGYWLNNYNDDTTRVSTKLLDGIATPIDVKITNPVYAIAGYMKFDANYDFVEYINSGFDVHHTTLPAGYIYEITLRRNSGGNLTPSDVAPYIVINDRLRIYELEQKTAQFVDTVIDVATFAEQDTWYQGMNIGDTVSKGSYTNCYALKQAVTPSEVYRLTAKGGSAGRGWYLLDSDNKIVDLSGVNFNDTIDIAIPNGVSYLLIQSNDGTSHLALTKYGQFSVLSAEINELETKFDNIETDIANLKNTADSFKCLTPFVWNKLSRMKNQETGFCNIGFIGDSWTQGTENIVDGVQSGFAGYVEPLTKLLQDEYGFGGLGWLDFARDGGSGKMFGCVDLYKRWTYQFSGTVTGLDGHNDQQAPNCLGICCAHTIFSNGASLTLGFDANVLDVFKLRYYKNAHFNVSVNGGTPVEVTANANDGWQETTFGTTGTNITSVVITALADDTIIFGMDCFFGTKGVRCHKIGNRSIEASDYLLMNATQWETGISLLNLCWCSVLLAINDLGGSTSETRMNTIVTNISNLINRLKVATDDGNGLVTCDINLLGVENIENSGWTGLGRLAEKQKAFAANNGYGWTNTDKCIGSNKAEFTYNGTFSDQIHLNKIGSYAYAKHIYNTLFKF